MRARRLPPTVKKALQGITILQQYPPSDRIRLVLGRAWIAFNLYTQKNHKMTKLIVQKEGTNWALGIIGKTKKEVEQRHWYFYHHDATNSTDLIWLKDDCEPFVGYFWTQEKRLKNCFRRGTLLEAMRAGLGGDFKGKKGGLMPFASEIAELKFLEIKSETFIDRTSRYFQYSKGSIEAENLSDWDGSRSFRKHR